VWPDQPDVSIAYTDVAYTVQVPVTASRIATVGSALLDLVKKPFVSGASNFQQMHALYPTSGRIRPASMTLVLAPPGHGKTSQHTQKRADTIENLAQRPTD